KALHSPVLTGERGGRDAPLSIAPLLMRVARTKLHRPQRPGRARRAPNRRLRKKLELPDAARSLTNARARTIGTGVAAADDHDAPIAGFVFSSEFLTFEPAILRRQKIHCEVHSIELATGNVEIPRLSRSCR